MKPTTIASLQKCKQDKKRFATIFFFQAEDGIRDYLQ